MQQLTETRLVLPALARTRRRRRIGFAVAGALSLLLHAGSLYAFLAWPGDPETGALERPSDAISVELVANRTLEAMQPQQSAEPAPSPEATAPVEGKTEASDAAPVQPQPKEAREVEIKVPQPPVVIPDATEEVMRSVKQDDRAAESEAPPLPVDGPAEMAPPPPKSGVSEDNAPAKRKEQKQPEKKKAAEPARKGGVVSKSAAGKGKGGERASASSGSILSYAAHVRARVAGNKPSGGGLRGTAVVSFGVTPSGGLAYASVARSSGSSQLDQLAVVGRARRGTVPHAAGRRHAGAAAVLDPVSFSVGREGAPLKARPKGGHALALCIVGQAADAGGDVVARVVGLGGRGDDAGDGGMAQDVLEEELRPARAVELGRPCGQGLAAHLAETARRCRTAG